MKRLSYILLSLFVWLTADAQLYEKNTLQIVELLAADSTEKAEDLILETIKLSPQKESNALLYQYLAEIYQRRGEEAKAISAYTASIDILPTERSLFFRAFLHQKARRYKEARADYDKLLELNPMHEDGRLGLAILNIKDGRPKEAFEQLNALTKFFPNHAKHLLVRCGWFEERKEYEKAMKDVAKALDVEPDNPDCYLTRASLYLAMKKKKKAAQDCRTAISLGANAEQVASLLAEISK